MCVNEGIKFAKIGVYRSAGATHTLFLARCRSAAHSRRSDSHIADHATSLRWPKPACFKFLQPRRRGHARIAALALSLLAVSASIAALLRLTAVSSLLLLSIASDVRLPSIGRCLTRLAIPSLLLRRRSVGVHRGDSSGVRVGRRSGWLRGATLLAIVSLLLVVQRSASIPNDLSRVLRIWRRKNGARRESQS